MGEVDCDAHGKPLRLVGALQDLTERKALEDRLRDSERFVTEITDNVPVALAFVDLQGRYQFVNRRHLARFGRPREEIIGRTRGELTDVPLEDAGKMVAAVLQGQAQRFTTTERFNGEDRLIDGQLVPAYDEHGAVKGFYATGVDITDLKRTEARLLELTEIIESTPDLVVETDLRRAARHLGRGAQPRGAAAADLDAERDH